MDKITSAINGPACLSHLRRKFSTNAPEVNPLSFPVPAMLEDHYNETSRDGTQSYISGKDKPMNGIEKTRGNNIFQIGANRASLNFTGRDILNHSRNDRCC